MKKNKYSLIHRIFTESVDAQRLPAMSDVDQIDPSKDYVLVATAQGRTQYRDENFIYYYSPADREGALSVGSDTRVANPLTSQDAQKGWKPQRIRFYDLSSDRIIFQPTQPIEVLNVRVDAKSGGSGGSKSKRLVLIKGSILEKSADPENAEKFDVMSGPTEAWLPQEYFQQVIEVNKEFVSPEQRTSAVQKYRSLTEDQKNQITSLIAPGGGWIAWDTALERVYDDFGVARPEIPREPGTVLASAADIEAGFDKKSSAAGKGEELSGAIFPNLIPVGESASEAGLDLFDIIANQKIEVKEPEFRVGAKSVAKVSEWLNQMRTLLAIVKNAAETIVEDARNVDSWRGEVENILQRIAQDPSLADRGARMSLVTLTNCAEVDPEKCGEDASRVAAYIDEIISNPQEFLESGRLTNAGLQRFRRVALRVPNALLAVLDEISEPLGNGEVTENRVRRFMKNISSLLYFDASGNPMRLQHKFLDGAYENGVINADQLATNMISSYYEALDPRNMFGDDTQIMIVTNTHYRMFSAQELGEEAASGSSRSQISQGRGKMNILKSVMNEVNPEKNPPNSAEGGTEGQAQPKISVAAPGVSNESQSYYDMHKLFEWAIR